MVTQGERRIRGLAAQELVKDYLPEACVIVAEHAGMEKGYKTRPKMTPDLELACDGEDIKMEVKESTSLEGAGVKKGVQTYRMGRFQLSSEDAKALGKTHKDCYALVLDDPLTDTVTIDFLKADMIEAFFAKRTKTGGFPKLPSYRLLQLREDRCFTDIGTVHVPREEYLGRLYRERH